MPGWMPRARQGASATPSSEAPWRSTGTRGGLALSYIWIDKEPMSPPNPDAHGATLQDLVSHCMGIC